MGKTSKQNNIPDDPAQLTLFDISLKTYKKKMSPEQHFKKENRYMKSMNKNNCSSCIHRIGTPKGLKCVGKKVSFYVDEHYKCDLYRKGD